MEKRAVEQRKLEPKKKRWQDEEQWQCMDKEECQQEKKKRVNKVRYYVVTIDKENNECHLESKEKTKRRWTITLQRGVKLEVGDGVEVDEDGGYTQCAEVDTPARKMQKDGQEE